MKEIQEKKIDDVNEVRQAVQKIGEKYLRSFRLRPGQKVWACDLKTGEVSEAVVESTPIIYKGRTNIQRKVIQEEMHIYVPAINYTNAERKFENVLKGRLTLRKK